MPRMRAVCILAAAVASTVSVPQGYSQGAAAGTHDPACAPADYACNLPVEGSLPGRCGDHLCEEWAGIVLQQEASQAPLPGGADALLQELAKANGIHIEAKVRFLNAETGATRSTATYEYWERGGRYRIWLSPVPGEGRQYSPWMDMAFDGVFVQGRPSPREVFVLRGGDRLIPFPDGPLALALAPFRLNAPGVCTLCQLRLADLNQAIAWRQAAAPSLAKTERTIRQGAFDAGFGRQGEVDSQGRLVRMVWPAGAQGHHLDVMLYDYRLLPGSSAMFPMRLLADIAPDVAVEYTVDTVEISPSFDDAELFNLGGTATTFIYTSFGKDGAAKTKVRHLRRHK